jgi:two-component system CheB/CheR fusion protein
VRFGLAIHELATNASKHGAAYGRRWSDEVRWTADKATPPGLLNLLWVEIGGPQVKAPPQRGLGATLVGSLFGARHGECHAL